MPTSQSSTSQGRRLGLLLTTVKGPIVALMLVYVAAACGTGSISFPGMSGGQNTPSTGSSTPTNSNTPVTTQAAGTMVGFEYVPGSDSAKAHPISDTAYWTQNAQAIQALATGSQLSARLAVVTTSNAGAVLNFPQGSASPISGATFSASDAYNAILTSLDAQRANVILEIQPVLASPVALAQAVLAQYTAHPCVVGISVDLRYYGKKLGKTKLSDDVATQLVQAVGAVSNNLQVQVRHNDGSYMPSSSVTNLIFVYDTENSGSEANMVGNCRQWAKDYSPSKVGFIIGSKSDRSWACALTLGPSQLIGDAASSGSNVTNLAWSSDTVSQLSPTLTFTCLTDTPSTGNNPNSGTGNGGGTNPNTPATTNPNTPGTTNPNTPATTNPNTPASTPNTTTPPTTNPNTTTGGGDTPASPNQTAGGGIFGF